MTTALDQAYASNTQTPLVTIEFLHSAITGGAIRLVQGYYDIAATLEDASSVTFTAIGMGFELPERGTDGRQDLQIQLDNVSNEVWTEIKAAKTATRTTAEKIICKYRPFLESNLTAPAGATYTLTVTKTSITRNSASIFASYTPIPEIVYPLNRYFPNKFPGLRYV